MLKWVRSQWFITSNNEDMVEAACSSCRIADICLLGLLDGHGTVETVESAFEISESFAPNS
jgi:hypothetical protein